MCGIIGYSGKTPVDPSDFKILLLYSENRGSHSTGFMSMEHGLVKANESAPYFVATHKVPESKLIIGHTRRPSANSPKDEKNAQPFGFEKIAGVHNGFFSDITSLENKLECEKDRVDSFPVILSLEKQGFVKTLEFINPSNSFALAWFNKETRKLYFYKSGKTLFYGYKDKGLYLASEKTYLDAIDCDAVEAVEYETLYTVLDGEIVEQKKYGLHDHSKNKTTSAQYDNFYGHGYNHGYSPAPKTTKKSNNPSYSSNVPKIDSNDAPESAKSMFHNGIKRYYWKDGKFLYVESCFGYRDTELEEFDLTKESESVEASRKFLPIIKAINEEMEK